MLGQARSAALSGVHLRGVGEQRRDVGVEGELAREVLDPGAQLGGPRVVDLAGECGRDQVGHLLEGGGIEAAGVMLSATRAKTCNDHARRIRRPSRTTVSSAGQGDMTLPDQIRRRHSGVSPHDVA